MIGNKWDEILQGEYDKEYFIKLKEFVLNEYKTKVVYPQITEIFNAFKLTDYDDVKVVFLGQDPYHDENQAEGLSFSVKDGVEKPPSLRNIFQEITNETGKEEPESGSLVSWAEEGVLLLNTVLTVEKDKAGSHSKKGWEIFTDEVIRKINEKDTPVVFILMGNYAKSKKHLIDNPIHKILETSHPSPLSAYGGFFGSNIFVDTNKFLVKTKQKPINW